jgi:hypothetical protein
MALAHRGVFRIGPHGRQALAWEVLSDGGPAIVEKYGGLNNASAYIGMMPGHSLGIVIRGSIPTKSAAAFCWTSPASNTQAAAARHAERAATVGERQDEPPQSRDCRGHVSCSILHSPLNRTRRSTCQKPR